MSLKTVKLYVDSFSSDGDSSYDMETAIESSAHHWSDSTYVLRTQNGAIINLSQRVSETSYSYVSGYDEGDGEIGGSSSRPSEISKHSHAEVLVPGKDHILDIPEFKRAISWIGGTHKAEDDDIDGVPSDFLVASGARALLAANPKPEVEAKIHEARNKYEALEVVSDDGLTKFLSESAIAELIDALPRSLVKGMHVDLTVSADLVDGISRLNCAAELIERANSEVVLSNMVNAANARIALRLEAIFPDNELSTRSDLSKSMRP